MKGYYHEILTRVLPPPNFLPFCLAPSHREAVLSSRSQGRHEANRRETLRDFAPGVCFMKIQDFKVVIFDKGLFFSLQETFCVSGCQSQGVPSGYV